MFALTVVSLALSAGVSLLFNENKKSLLVLCASAFVSGVIILPTINVFNRYAIIIAFGPLAEEICRFFAIRILGQSVVLRLNRWIVGLGFWSTEGFSKCIRFIDEIINWRQVSWLFALRVGGGLWLGHAPHFNCLDRSV